MAVCLIERSSATLTFAGARLSLFVEQGGKTEVYPGGRFSVGYAYKKEAQFEERKINLEKDKVFYLCTDGLLDQNGGGGRNGLGKKGFTSLIASLTGLSMDEKRAGIERFIESRLSQTDQRDDITIVGFTLQ